jgi:DNA-binding response OmpR family regulator
MSHDNFENRKRILLLEDDIPLADMLRDFLQCNGFSVETAENGAEGVRKILDQEFDIILCDMVMPHLPGDMFYTAVSRINPALCRRFIFMTGHQADPKYDQFIRKVKGTMLWKPFLLSDLLSVVKLTVQRTPRAHAGGNQKRAWSNFTCSISTG